MKFFKGVLFLLLLSLVMVQGASATSSDWFEDSTFNTTRWEWVNEPTNYYDIDTTSANHIFVNTTNYNDPDDATNNNISLSTYGRQPVVDTEYNVSIKMNALLMDANYEITALVLENSSQDHVSICVLRNAGNREIRFNSVVAGTRTQVDKVVNIPQADTENLYMKIQVYNDAGTTKINAWYTLDDGIPISSVSSYTSPFDSFEYVGVVYSSNGATDTSQHVDDFIWNDETHIPKVPIDVTGSDTYHYFNINDSRVANLTDLREWINNTYDPGNADNYLRETSPKTWESEYAIFRTNINGTFWINSTDCLELKIDNTIGTTTTKRRSLVGAIVADTSDTVINNWNLTSDMYHTYAGDTEGDNTNGRVFLTKAGQNATFSNFFYLHVGVNNSDLYPYPEYERIDNGVYDGLKIYNNSAQINAIGNRIDGINSVIKNVSVINYADQSKGAGLFSFDLENGYVDNVYVNIKGTESSNGYGVLFKPLNTTIKNIYINNSIYSGALIKSGSGSVYYDSMGSHVENISVFRSPHNGLEMQVNNITFDTAYVYGSKYHNYFTAADIANDVSISNISLTNGTSVHPGSFAFAVGENTTYSTFSNLNLTGSGVYVVDSHHIIFINVSHINDLVASESPAEQSGIYQTQVFSVESNNNTYVNFNTQNNNYRSIWHVNGAYTTYANVNTSDGIDFDGGDYTQLYPLNMIVSDSSSNPIENANITITTDSFTLDGLGHEQYSFITGADGKPTEQINIANLTRDSSTGYAYHFSNVTVEKDGVSDSKYNIVPDSSNLQGTLYTFIIGDVEEAATTSPSSSAASGTRFSTSPIDIHVDPVTATVTSYQMWSVGFIIGLLILISGLADTNKKVKQAPAIITGLAICLVAGSYVGIFSETIHIEIISIIKSLSGIIPN